MSPLFLRSSLQKSSKVWPWEVRSHEQRQVISVFFSLALVSPPFFSFLRSSSFPCCCGCFSRVPRICPQRGICSASCHFTFCSPRAWLLWWGVNSYSTKNIIQDFRFLRNLFNREIFVFFSTLCALIYLSTHLIILWTDVCGWLLWTWLL